jgi:hypothetical protein
MQNLFNLHKTYLLTHMPISDLQTCGQIFLTRDCQVYGPWIICSDHTEREGNNDIKYFWWSRSRIH